MQESETLPRAHGEALGAVDFRQSPESFIVDEQLIFEPDGEGEHVYLQIRKRNTNTQWLAKQLAKISGIKVRDVSYAGLKDRHAVTTQWFSLILQTANEPEWQSVQLDNIEILQSTRHRCKLRPGMVKQNRFVITLGNVMCTDVALAERLALIKQLGVPNYFGRQRFGHGEENITQARKMFAGDIKIRDRKLKGIYLSAARSYLFNRVLAERVRLGTWDKAIAGDCMMLDGSNSFFKMTEPDREIEKRINEFDIHPSGPMWGKGESVVSLAALQLEQKVLINEQAIMQGLESANLKMDRRALRMQVQKLRYNWLDKGLLAIEFELASGQYATTVLKELFDLNEANDYL